MADLKKVFNIGKLNDHELGCVEFVLNSPAYQDVFKPYLESMQHSLSMSMLDRGEARKKEYPDDFLAGGIVAIKGLLELFDHLVNETRIDRIDAAQQTLSATNRYDMDQRSGQHDPILGANEPIADPDNPRYESAPGDRLSAEEDY